MGIGNWKSGVFRLKKIDKKGNETIDMILPNKKMGHLKWFGGSII